MKKAIFFGLFACMIGNPVFADPDCSLAKNWKGNPDDGYACTDSKGQWGCANLSDGQIVVTNETALMFRAQNKNSSPENCASTYGYLPPKYLKLPY